MHPPLITILAYVFIYLIYLTGKFLFCLRFGIHAQHLFLGFGKNPAFTCSLGRVKISLGLFIPLPFLAKFYAYNNEGVKEQIKMEWEYFEKPIHQRLITNFGGAIFMTFTAMVFFTIVSFMSKDVYIGKDQIDKYGIYPDSIARSYGFEKGDRITAINDQPYGRFTDLKARFLDQDQTVFTIERGDDELEVITEQDLIYKLNESNYLFAINAPFKLSRVSEKSQAEEMGLQKGDILVGINQRKITSIEEFVETLGYLVGDSIQVHLERGDQVMMLKAVVPVTGKLGFYSKTLVEYTSYKRSLFEAILEGISEPFYIMSVNIKAFVKHVFGDTVENKKLSGPIGIAELFGGFSWLRYTKITALLLSVFAFYEFLPFPRTAMTRSIPLAAEGFFKKCWSFETYRRINKALWVIILMIFLWSVIKDIMLLF
ncbi:MAG: site-2 protease family protein [Marinoscillum sp.]